MQEKLETHNINRDFLLTLQEKFGGTISGDRYTYDPKIAMGFQHYVYVPSDIHIVIANYFTQKKVVFNRSSTTEDIYTFRAGIIENNLALLKIDNQNVSDSETVTAPIALTKSSHEIEMVFEPNTQVMAVAMNLSPQLINYYFPDFDFLGFIDEMLETKSLQLVALDKIGRRTIIEIINKNPYDENYNLFIRTRMLELVDYYFQQLLKIKKFSKLVKTKKWMHYVEVFKKLEMDILADLSKKIPKIEEAAQRLYLSTTKFKTLFKDIYNFSYYEYYNNSRLNLAKLELLKGEKSVKEIAHLFGFNNTGQFSNAFKKHFKFNPSEFKHFR